MRVVSPGGAGHERFVDTTTASPTASDPDALVVKFQTIVRDGKEIIVGRLKVPTVSRSLLVNGCPADARSQLLPAPLEHAFILRRYDTGAISVTTMYKAAFPSATAEDEEREMKWIKSSFDMSGMNGSRTCNAVKLAGNWCVASHHGQTRIDVVPGLL